MCISRAVLSWADGHVLMYTGAESGYLLFIWLFTIHLPYVCLCIYILFPFCILFSFLMI